MKIFVIDDEESIRETFKFHFESKGHEVITAENPTFFDIENGCGDSNFHPCGDILITDYLMPQMTGLELIQHLRQGGCKRNPANNYIMSGVLNGLDMDRVNEYECNFLQKPVTFEMLDHIIEDVIRRNAPT